MIRVSVNCTWACCNVVRVVGFVVSAIMVECRTFQLAAVGIIGKRRVLSSNAMIRVRVDSGEEFCV